MTSLRQAERNTFLDAVRTIALVRVIVWHTYGYAWISYFIASMPAMFFVAGTLMATSLRRGSALDVLYRRFRRLLLPFWLLGAVALAVMLVYEGRDPAAHVDLRYLAWWVVPLWDPTGSEWGLTWWAPLWYIRCLTWLLLASPLLLWLWHRAGPWLLLAPVMALLLMEERVRAGAAVPWQLQDAALYSLFWLLGFAYQEGRFNRLSTATRAALCLAFAAGSAAFALTQDVPAGIVNASYPLHLLVGLAWLFGSLALEAPIARMATVPRVSSVIYWINERALTVYLWQSLGLFAMYQILWAEPRSQLTRDLLALPIVASITFLAVLLLGWVEDVAAARRPRFWPDRRPLAGTPRLAPRAALLAGSAAVAGLAALLVAGSNVVNDPSHLVQASARTVPPSGAGLHFRAQRAQITSSAPARPVSGLTGPVEPQELQDELEAWLRQWNISGATVTLLRPTGEEWTGAAGLHESGAPFEVNEPFWIASITKTFTTALIMRLVDEGRLGLDDPVSLYVPDFPDSERFTVRHLLQHTSGLIVGDEKPYDALVEAARVGLQFQPGKAYEYSRAGYYLLGLIIEDRLAMPYTEAVHQLLLAPLGLQATWMDEEILPLPYSTHPYFAGAWTADGGIWTSSGLYRQRIQGFWHYYGTLWSSGGLWSTTSDLARWALALWGSEEVVSAAALQQMTTFLGKEFDYTGLGTYPFCPCWQEGGRLRAERWGFAGATGVVEYDPDDEIAFSVHMSGSLWDENVVTALDDLSIRMRRLVRGRPMPVP